MIRFWTWTEPPCPCRRARLTGNTERSARDCRSDQRSGARLAQPSDAGGGTPTDAEVGDGRPRPDRSAISAASSQTVRAESAAPTRSSSSVRVSRPSATAAHRMSTAVSRSASEARRCGWNSGSGRMKASGTTGIDGRGFSHRGAADRGVAAGQDHHRQGGDDAG